MKDNHREYEERRETSKKDKAENKRVVLEGKQRTIYKGGKKIIVPSKVVIQDVNQPVSSFGTVGEGNTQDDQPVEPSRVSSAMDEEKPVSAFGHAPPSRNTMDIEK